MGIGDFTVIFNIKYNSHFLLAFGGWGITNSGLECREMVVKLNYERKESYMICNINGFILFIYRCFSFLFI
jgi:hypothetical protein